MTDYWRDADAHVGNVHWQKPGTIGDFRRPPSPDLPRRTSGRGLFLPVGAVTLAILLSVWGSGMLKGSDSKDRPAPATTSRGLVFGLCSEGGLTNCVASGDSFYLGGKTVRVAALGRKWAAKLQFILYSGELEMTKMGQDLERYGLLLRNVAVDGKDVGQALVGAGLARDIGDMTRIWC